MAIQTETSRVVYAGNNSTVTPYPVTFQFLDNADLVVVVTTSAGVQTTLVLTTDYAIAGSGYPTASASITTVVAVPVTSTVTLFRDTAFTQTASYTEADEFPAASHERALDKATILAQQLQDSSARTFRLTVASPQIAEVAAVNNALLGLNPAGVPFFKTASEVLTWLQLVQTLGNFPLKTWADAAERSTAVPDFIGQVGSQRDTNVLYLGTALSAGSWAASVSSVADGVVTTAKLADGALSADAAGRLKMAAAFLMASHMNADTVNGQTTKALLADADKLLGWSSADAALRTFAGNVAVPPGSVIQTVEATPYATSADITTVIPIDDTLPQIGEGTQILTLTITPRFSDSKIALRCVGTASGNSLNIVTALFRDSVSNTIKASNMFSAANQMVPVLVEVTDSPGVASATIYTARTGPGSAGTIRHNGSPTARFLGGAMATTLIAEEIKV